MISLITISWFTFIKRIVENVENRPKKEKVKKPNWFIEGIKSIKNKTCIEIKFEK